MNYSFGLWERGNDNAEALKELLARPDVWESQRTDQYEHELFVNADYGGCFVWIFWKGLEPVGFVIFMPQRCGLWEMHLGYVPGTSVLGICRGVLKAIEAAFGTGDIDQLCAPCPDWNPKIAEFAMMVRERICGQKGANGSWYRVKSYAARDGEKFGALVFTMSRANFQRTQT